MATFRFHGELVDLVPRRRETVERAVDGMSSLLHWVQSIGVPHTELGSLEVAGRPVAPSYVVRPGDVVDVHPRPLPQRPPHPPRFACDVHLGTVARWLRLLGVDTAYANDASDDDLVVLSAVEERTLLTQDRGLLRRRAAVDAAYVRGAGPDDQLRDVVRRFDLVPALRPLTRCPACNGELAAVAKDDVAEALEPGTRRSYDEFSRCGSCGRVYWRGAHHARIAALVAAVSSGR